MVEANPVEDAGFVGGGSLPDQAMKTWCVEVHAGSLSDAELARRLRTGTPAVMARIRGGKVVLDVRTIFLNQESAVVEAVAAALATGQASGSETAPSSSDGPDSRRGAEEIA